MPVSMLNIVHLLGNANLLLSLAHGVMRKQPLGKRLVE